MHITARPHGWSGEGLKEVFELTFENTDNPNTVTFFVGHDEKERYWALTGDKMPLFYELRADELITRLFERAEEELRYTDNLSSALQKVSTEQQHTLLFS